MRREVAGVGHGLGRVWDVVGTRSEPSKSPIFAAAAAAAPRRSAVQSRRTTDARPWRLPLQQIAKLNETKQTKHNEF